MTLYCKHRINDPNELAQLDPRYGVEIDLRTFGEQIVLEHDPYTPGPLFTDWLDNYRHAFIVLNIKEEGLEQRIIAELEKRGIRNWAFLDQSFPFLVRLLRTGETRTMVRVSEFESIETALSLSPRPDWVWLDSFSGAWPSAEKLQLLSQHGFSIMLVSPELQGRDLDAEIEVIRSRFRDANVEIAGVCTKLPTVWEHQ